MKKHIIYFALEKRDTTSFWRIFPLSYIQNNEFTLTDISDQRIFDWTVFGSKDIFIIQRPFSRDHIQIITGAKNMGLKVIADYDDDLTCVDMYNPTHNLYHENKANLNTCLKLCDEVWVSTQSIKDSYKSINDNIYVIPNAHNDYLFKIKDKKQFNSTLKNVFYRGGGSHQADVNEVADKLVSIINENKDWTFGFMGDRFTYIEQRTTDNHHIIPPMSIMEYFRYINEINPQIMVFPLCNTKFNRGKSNISFLEATYTGAAFFGNTLLPEFNKEFIWPINALKTALTDDNIPLLEQSNQRSWEYICDELLLSKVNKLREQRIIANL